MEEFLRYFRVTTLCSVMQGSGIACVFDGYFGVVPEKHFNDEIMPIS